MGIRLVPKSVTLNFKVTDLGTNQKLILNDLERRNGVILRYFSEFG